ncbi:DUF4129 domain-containing protein [Halomicroarcula sp. GCM10025894]|uniref:DUF4129 domain-containing protein n=1 Tax=Halomicroarcula sp. GCM10025894 TaxID=3252673 RepID=UPI0036165C0A
MAPNAADLTLGTGGATRRWLRSVPGRLAAWLRSLPLRGVAAAVGAVALVAGATYAFGGRGFLVAAAVVSLACLGWWLSGRESTASVAGDADDATATGSGRSTDTGTVPTLRRLWRRLASWVLPGTWQTKTPAEVSRAAVERGLPRGPVERLTEAFRDVEYGGRPADERQSQARTAIDEIERARDGAEEERE